MASQMDIQGPKPQEANTKRGRVQEVGNKDMVNFLDLIRTIADNTSTIWIDQVLKENEKLKALVMEKDNSNETFIRAITNLRGSLDKEAAKAADATAQSKEDKAKATELTIEIEGAKKTITEKDQQLKDDAAKIAELEGKISALETQLTARDDTISKHERQQADDNARMKELEGALGTTKVDLDIKVGELKEIRSLSWDVKDGSKDHVSKELDKIYGYAKLLATKYFGDDLPEDVLSDARLIDGISALVKPIPFPPSNSPAAKKARIAAFLASLGSKLADRIFLPFYQIDQDQDGIDSIAVMLSELSITDPRRELHLRSVLLGIAPTEQREVAYARAQEIANEIYAILGILLSSEKQAQFHVDIKKLCRLAVDSWDGLRALKEKIEPFTETSEETEKYWLPAELESTTSIKKQPVNGASKLNGLASKPSLHSLRSANKVVLVWPGFSYGAEVLKQGFMLLDSQVKVADDEMRPLRRNVRAMQRASTNPSIQTHRLSGSRSSKIFPRSAAVAAD